MILGAIASAATGIALPIFSLIFGQMIDSFKPTATPDEIVEMACDGQYKLPEHCIITGPLKTGKPLPEQRRTFSEGDYHNLLLAAYEGLRELILAPSDKFIHRFVNFPVVWNS